MPKLTKSLPSYLRQKASGQAVVTLDGKDYYLGPHGSRPSRREYDRLVGEWQTNGRRMPAGAQHVSTAELLAQYWRLDTALHFEGAAPCTLAEGLSSLRDFELEIDKAFEGGAHGAPSWTMPS